MKVLRIHRDGPRVETGPVQFGNDWPGVFIRGDEALHFAMILEMATVATKSSGFSVETQYIKSLTKILNSCNTNPHAEAT